MREEASRLWEQAKYDLNTSSALVDIGIPYAAVFFAEQAAEKAVKAMYIVIKRKTIATHDLVKLVEELKAPLKIVEAAIELSPDYIMTRYPDAANGIPAKLYNKKSAIIHLNFARTIIEWVKKDLKLAD